MPNSKPETSIQALSPEKTMDFLKQYVQTDADPAAILRDLGKTSAEWLSGNKNQKLQEKLNEQVNKALPILALDNHFLLAETVGQHYRPFIIQFAQQIIEEYRCQTPTEKAVAETIAGSYGRILELSQRVNSSLHIEYLSNEKTGYYGMLAKELDRAHRQFSSSLLVLKQMKAPNIEVNIKAKNAFIAQNQQINARPTNDSGNEIPSV